MKQQRLSARHASRRNRTTRSAAYLFFCISIVFAVGLLIFSGFILEPPAAPSVEAKAADLVPVATIQLYPDRKGICRQLLFHNDSGRVDEGGFAPCRDLIPEQMLVETVRGRRLEAIAKVFKFR